MGSNSLAFKTWCRETHVYHFANLEEFKDAVIGIDAEDYLHSLLVTRNVEPLLPAHGGEGFTLKQRVDDDLAKFEEAGIVPYFVFNGLDLACKDRASILKESLKAAQNLGNAWQIYDEGKGEDSVVGFGKACTYRTYHIVRSLMMHLHRKGVHFLVAPYTAAAQLAYMERVERVDGVAGSASCLLYGCERVIIDWDWDQKQVKWTDFEICTQRLQLTQEDFVGACLISGSSILPALPEFDGDDSVSKLPAAARKLKDFRNDMTALLHSQGNGYINEFYKAKFALAHPIQLEENGAVKPKDWDGAPGDVHEFIGQRLPGELYEYLSRGLVGPRVLNWRTRAEVLETPPLDGGVSPTYQDLVETKLRPIRAQALAVMTEQLHRYYQNTEVELACWWKDQNKTALNVKDRLPAVRTITEGWHAKAAQRPRTNDSEIMGSGLMYAIMALSKDADAKKTMVQRPKDVPPPLKEFEDVRTNIVWRFMQDRGYLNEDHTLSGWGKVLKASFERAANAGRMSTKESKAEMEEAIFLAIELIRLDILGTQQMFPTPPYSGGLLRGSDKDKSNAMLISRVACLGTVRHDKIGYTGPLARILLAYHQTIAVVRGALRDLLEMHASYIFMAASVDRNWTHKMYTDLGASLPFVTEPDVGLGLVVKSYLDELSSNNRIKIQQWFAHVVDMDENLERAWSMWDAINAGVQAADSSIVNSDTKMTFKNADSWLKTKLEHAKELEAGEAQTEQANGVPHGAV